MVLTAAQKEQKSRSEATKYRVNVLKTSRVMSKSFTENLFFVASSLPIKQLTMLKLDVCHFRRREIPDKCFVHDARSKLDICKLVSMHHFSILFENPLYKPLL